MEIIVRATPGARRERIEQRGDVWHVWVTVQPEHGQANDKIKKLLAEALDIPQSSLLLKRGAGSRTKVYVVSA